MIKIYPNIKIAASLLSLISLPLLTNAQLFYNNGATVYIGYKSLVHINGSAENAGATANIWNRGELTIASKTTTGINNATPGTYTMSTSSVTKGSGYYKVEQDWINNASFLADTSTVELYGDNQQLITSTNGTATEFDTLVLTGAGTGNNRKKTLQNVGASIKSIGALIINDRELATDANVMEVKNTDLNAVTNATTYGSEGFVSSLIGGSLTRHTQNNAVYRFPTGSSLGTLRYRELQLTPSVNTPLVYAVKLANNDATADGYDLAQKNASICKLNNLFYHTVNAKSGMPGATVDVTVFYDGSADGNWASLAEWDIPTTSFWNELNATATTASPYTPVTKTAWFDAASVPENQIVLSGKQPTAPALACANICEGSQGVFQATGTAGSTFQWTVSSNGNIINGQGTDIVSVNWGTGTGTISVTETNTTAGCASLAAVCNVTPLAVPTAAFDTAAVKTVNNTYIVTDKSTGGTQWTWDFGDGTPLESGQNPFAHTYAQPGKYTIKQIVTNGNCTDTITSVIDITEYIYIPNVFTPNKDGTNDFFYIGNNGFKEFKIEIYNRWGMKLFESDNANMRWDGKTIAGTEAPDGTYYFILYAKGYSGKDYGTAGYLSLIK